MAQQLIVQAHFLHCGLRYCDEAETTSQLGSWAREAPNFAVALNCGTGSSFLKALVKAFDRLHMVRGENSGYSGSKYWRWTSCSRPFGASSLPSTNAE